MCKVTRHNFYCPEAISGNRKCPCYMGPNIPDGMSYGGTFQGGAVICGKYREDPTECPELHRNGNLTVVKVWTMECPTCDARMKREEAKRERREEEKRRKGEEAERRRREVKRRREEEKRRREEEKEEEKRRREEEKRQRDEEKRNGKKEVNVFIRPWA